MVLNKIEDIDTFIKKLYSTWTNYFGKKKKNRKHNQKYIN